MILPLKLLFLVPFIGDYGLLVTDLLLGDEGTFPDHRQCGLDERLI